MKSRFTAVLSALFISSSLYSGLDRDRTLFELDEIQGKFTGCPPHALISMNHDNLDEFLSAMGRIKDYIDENSKNKFGIKEEKLEKAVKQLDNRSKEILVLIGAIKGTRTTEGLKELNKLLKEHEERLVAAEKTLSDANYDNDDKKDAKKNAKEVLSEGVESLKSLISQMTKASEYKIKELEKPVKRVKKTKKGEKTETNAEESTKSTKITTASDLDDITDIELDDVTEEFLDAYQVLLITYR